jgi:hypothetical protein
LGEPHFLYSLGDPCGSELHDVLDVHFNGLFCNENRVGYIAIPVATGDLHAAEDDHQR